MRAMQPGAAVPDPAHEAALAAYGQARRAEPSASHRRAMWLALLAAGATAAPRVAVVWGEPAGIAGRGLEQGENADAV